SHWKTVQELCLQDESYYQSCNDNNRRDSHQSDHISSSSLCPTVQILLSCQPQALCRFDRLISGSACTDKCCFICACGLMSKPLLGLSQEISTIEQIVGLASPLPFRDICTDRLLQANFLACFRQPIC